MESLQMDFDIGKRIKALREDQSLSLRALAKKCGLSFNAISRIERGENSPSVVTLHRLATAFGVPITYFFMKEVEQKIIFTKHNEGIVSRSSGFEMQSLGSGLIHQQLEPFHMLIKPGGRRFTDPVSHAGDELVYCLEGKLEYKVEHQVFTLEKGDSLFFKGDQGHCWRNPFSAEARVLIIFQSTPNKHNLFQGHLTN
ncbi:MAG: helix-turn-helix domain-containing protein [Gemmatimonadetes bacterium]|nr:MAG: helix-turn-helix domain-containing protein [Gemmatimonadota bacterium]